MEQQKKRLRTAVGRGYDHTLGKILPSDRLLAVLFCLLLNSIVYWGAQTVTSGWTMLDMTTAIDRWIPLMPAWTFIYVGAYLFWAVGYVLMARGRNWYSIMTAEVFAKLICGAFFLLLPTTNLRPTLSAGTVGAWLLEFIYESDAASNLFPSIHCLESWICFTGLRNRKDVPKWYRVFSGIFAVLVCVSTLMIRQHVIADVIAGVLLAEVSIRLSSRFGAGNRLYRAFNGLDRKIFGWN